MKKTSEIKRVYDIFYPIYLDSETIALVESTGVRQTSPRRMVDMCRYFGTRRRRSTFYLSGSSEDYAKMEEALREKDAIFYVVDGEKRGRDLF